LTLYARYVTDSTRIYVAGTVDDIGIYVIRAGRCESGVTRLTLLEKEAPVLSDAESNGVFNDALIRYARPLLLVPACVAEFHREVQGGAAIVALNASFLGARVTLSASSIRSEALKRPFRLSKLLAADQPTDDSVELRDPISVSRY
jgi:hypothetical protein